MTIKHFLLNFFGKSKMCDKMAISAYILKIVKNDPFLRLQMTAKEMFKTSFNYCSSGSGQNSVIPVLCNVPE